jgi:dynein heavy chain 2
LEKELKGLEPHPNFRLWLTTEPHAKFPPILLETSLKVTYEAPPGVKKNLLRTLETWTDSWFSSGTDLRSQVIFICAHFHAIMQERRTYIPQGWSKFYEFSSSDLQSACETVSMLLQVGSANAGSGAAAIDWVALTGVMELAIYGSRVDNDFDARLVREYLNVFFRTEVLEGPGRKGPGGVDIPPFEIPATTRLSEFRTRVEKLPDLDNPASFGMAANADRSLQRINSSRVIAALRQLMSAAGAEQGGSKSVNIKAASNQLSPLWKFWDDVTKSKLSKLRAVAVRAVTPEDPPIVAFVLMDAMEAARLADVVSNSLANIQSVCNGSALSTPEVQNEALYLIRAEVPPSWMQGWPSAPEDPSQYLKGLEKRLVALKTEWLKRVATPAPLKEPVKLSDFLRPDVFLNALRQQTARKLGESVDGLHLIASFQPSLMSDPSICPLPVTMQELFLEGCAFDDSKGVLVEGTRNSPLVCELPLLTVAWVARKAHPERAVSASRGAAAVDMPIYVSLNREICVTSVQLHADNGRGRILNSAALFLTQVD